MLYNAQYAGHQPMIDAFLSDDCYEDKKAGPVAQHLPGSSDLDQKAREIEKRERGGGEGEWEKERERERREGMTLLSGQRRHNNDIKGIKSEHLTS